MIWYDMIWYMIRYDMRRYDAMRYGMIYLLTATVLPPGGSSTVHSYTQTIHRTIQLTTLVGWLSGIRTQSGQTDWEECRPCPVFASYVLAFALQLRKRHWKPSEKHGKPLFYNWHLCCSTCQLINCIELKCIIIIIIIIIICAPQIYLHFPKFLTTRRSSGRSETRSLYALHILCLASLSIYIDII
jgi:hypothetical protein